MKGIDDAAARLGLALYRKTVVNGPIFYSIYDLVFEEGDSAPRHLFLRMFSTRENFWGVQQEAARILEGARLVTAQRRQIAGSGAGDYLLKLTPLGKAFYSLAHLQFDGTPAVIEGIGAEDVAAVLANDSDAESLVSELACLDVELDKLPLSNFQRASVNSYVIMLTAICNMPERDAKLFWIILERVNQFAGVASLIVALIALKVAR